MVSVTEDNFWYNDGSWSASASSQADVSGDRSYPPYAIDNRFE